MLCDVRKFSFILTVYLSSAAPLVFGLCFSIVFFFFLLFFESSASLVECVAGEGKGLLGGIFYPQL